MENALKGRIIDDYNRALNDLFGLVPKAHREHAITYLRQLQSFGVVLSDAFEVIDRLDVARSTFERSAKYHADQSERIGAGE